MTPDAARNLADSELAFVASDEALASALLEASGASPQALRDMAAQPHFGVFLLDFLLDADERTMRFAAAVGVPPERVGAARSVLAGPVESWP